MAYGAPIGTAEERATHQIWPGKWIDANPYLSNYSQGYHTGADLNLNFPHWDADKHATVYAMGSGTVTYAQLYSTQVWGKLIVIDHGIVDGRPLFSRYAHVDTITPGLAGQQVGMGDPIGTVGNAEGLFPYHLHFDISLTDVLRAHPSHWPGTNRALLLANYADPKAWLQAHVPGAVMPGSHDWYIIASVGLRVREQAGISGHQVGILPFGTRVTLEDGSAVERDSYRWSRIVGGNFNGDWMATNKTDNSEVFVTQNPPPPGP